MYAGLKRRAAGWEAVWHIEHSQRLEVCGAHPSAFWLLIMLGKSSNFIGLTFFTYEMGITSIFLPGLFWTLSEVRQVKMAYNFVSN